jgi:thiosulfate/3-mercaptopyruvate sulfurtransferase
VKVLNGGWRAWVNAGQAVDFDRPRAPASVTFTPRADDSFIVTGDELKEACALDNVVVWDVRSDAEWDGTTENYQNKRVGHVPGAVHLEWFHLMDRNTHEFRPAAEIRRILTEHGITPDKTAYSY